MLPVELPGIFPVITIRGWQNTQKRLSHVSDAALETTTAVMCADFVAPGGNHWEILWDDLQKILEKEFTNSGWSMIFHIYVCSRATIWENMLMMDMLPIAFMMDDNGLCRSCIVDNGLIMG